MDPQTLAFRTEENGRRYVALLGGEEVGFADVDLIGADGLLVKHTEVGERFEGKGYAGQLMRHILEDAKRQGRGVIPVCPYAASYVKRHPEYLAYLRADQRERLTRS